MWSRVQPRRSSIHSTDQQYNLCVVPEALDLTCSIREALNLACAIREVLKFTFSFIIREASHLILNFFFEFVHSVLVTDGKY